MRDRREEERGGRREEGGGEGREEERGGRRRGEGGGEGREEKRGGNFQSNIFIQYRLLQGDVMSCDTTHDITWHHMTSQMTSHDLPDSSGDSPANRQ